MFERSSALAAASTVLSAGLQVAPTDSTVLITGETARARSLIAGHPQAMPRSARAFVAVNCARFRRRSSPPSCFGHEKGRSPEPCSDARVASSWRRRNHLPRRGRRASRRDPDHAAARPCRSANRACRWHRAIRVNVRVIAATNRNLLAAVADGTFRADLFYRLNVFPLDVPLCANRRPISPCSSNLHPSLRHTRRQANPLLSRETVRSCFSRRLAGNDPRAARTSSSAGHRV